MTNNKEMEKFIINGGKISTHPYILPENEPNIIKSNNCGPQNMYSLDEAAHFLSERKKRKQVEINDFSEINWTLIPEPLRLFLKEGLNAKNK